MLERITPSGIRRYLERYGDLAIRIGRRLLLIFLVVYGLALVGSPFVFKNFIAESFPLVIFSYSDGLSLIMRLALVLAVMVMVPISSGMVLVELYRRGAMHTWKSLFVTFFLAVFLFFLGLAFAAFILLPFLITFITRLGQDFHIDPLYGAVQYTSFVVGLMLPMGMFFELPLVITLLVRLNIVTLTRLKRIRKYVYFFLYVIASMITPPDVMTHVMAALPLIALYEMGLFVAARMAKNP